MHKDKDVVTEKKEKWTTRTSSIQGWFSLRTESELYSEAQSDAIQWNRACTVNFWAGRGGGGEG